MRKAQVLFNSKKVTYGRIECDYRQQKSEKYRTQLMVGGNLLDFPGALATPTATVTTVKCFFNSVISTKNTKCMTADIQNFYLNNKLDKPEYMKMHVSLILTEIFEEYVLRDKVDDKGWIYIQINKGMYGLKQVGVIENQELIKHLKPYGYHPVKLTL